MKGQTMAFKRVNGERTYFKYAACNKDDMLVKEGLYVGEVEGKYGVEHIFKQEHDGKTVVLNHSGHLDWLLKEYATPGRTLCNVIYDEKVILTKGAMTGKPAHRFHLEVDDGKGEKATHSDVVSETVLAGREAVPVPPVYDGPDISL